MIDNYCTFDGLMFCFCLRGLDLEDKLAKTRQMHCMNKQNAQVKTLRIYCIAYILESWKASALSNQ